MAVTLTDIRADIGELYDSVSNGTTSISSVITRAEDYVKGITGTTTGYDSIVRPLADAMVVNQMMGSIDSVNKTIGNLSVGNKDLATMQRYFQAEANKVAIIKGYSLDGYRILFEDSA